MIALVTTGPASAPIDEVRQISNFSTGEVGALLAEALLLQGFQVLLFRGDNATHRDVPVGAALRQFATNRDLMGKLLDISATRGQDVRAVFHAAALSDYEVTSIKGPEGDLSGKKKIPGNLSFLHLTLQPAEKILPRLASWFPQAWIVGWKYQMEGTREEAIKIARTQLEQGRIQASVINGGAYGSGFGLLEGSKSPLHFENRRETAYFLASQARQSAKADH